MQYFSVKPVDNCSAGKLNMSKESLFGVQVNILWIMEKCIKGEIKNVL